MELRTDFIDAKPITFDFGEGYTETWDVVVPQWDELEWRELRAWLQNQHGDDYADKAIASTVDGYCDAESSVDALRELCREAWDEDECGFPMMNYAYPAPDDADPLRVPGPLTVVDIGAERYLALTGGGMDLSWEICAAYVALGYYPPAHFCELPAMAGRGESDDDRHLMTICVEALDIIAGWHSRAADRLRERMLDKAC